MLDLNNLYLLKNAKISSPSCHVEENRRSITTGNILVPATNNLIRLTFSFNQSAVILSRTQMFYYNFYLFTCMVYFITFYRTFIHKHLSNERVVSLHFNVGNSTYTFSTYFHHSIFPLRKWCVSISPKPFFNGFIYRAQTVEIKIIFYFIWIIWMRFSILFSRHSTVSINKWRQVTKSIKEWFIFFSFIGFLSVGKFI